jgi:hypothetical protein
MEDDDASASDAMAQIAHRSVSWLARTAAPRQRRGSDGLTITHAGERAGADDTA